MKNIKEIAIGLLLIVFVFFLGKCTASPGVITRTIVLPAVQGKSDTIYKPGNNTKIIERNYIYRDSVIKHDKEFDEEMVNRFAKLNSEYDKIKAYIKATELNTYTIPIEDSLIKSTVNLTVRGELVSIQRDYVLKERSVDISIKVPQTKFALYGGLGLQSNIDLTNIQPTANILLENSKGNILGLQVGLDKSVQLSYSIKVFDYKR